MYARLPKIALASTMLAMVVIVLGAYTRLTDSGLGCPDWPGCYGRLIAPVSNTPEAVKAWIEMIHRYVAGSFGLLALFMLIAGAPRLLSLTLVAVVIFQALLGMWTVTLKLYPAIVLAHLLGGMAILSLSWLLTLKLIAPRPLALPTNSLFYLALTTMMVITLQIALGGWTSANYAALVCKDFPTCQSSWWPPMDWQTAFNFTATGIFDSPGMPLENTARVTIQMAHRVGAVVTTLMVGILTFKSYKATKSTLFQRVSLVTVLLLLLQLSLGIANVMGGLPLTVAVLHNAIAACLLLAVTTIAYFTRNTANAV